MPPALERLFGTDGQQTDPVFGQRLFPSVPWSAKEKEAEGTSQHPEAPGARCHGKMSSLLRLPRLPPVSERYLLVQLNTVLALFSTLLVASCSVILDQLFTNVPEVENTQAAIQGSRIFVYVVLVLVLGVWALITTLIGIVAAIRVNFVMLMFYFWSILLSTPWVCIFGVLCLDFQAYFETWARLNWEQDDMRRIRSFFCDDAALSLDLVTDIRDDFGRDSTSNYECVVPVEGGRFFPTENAWCADNLQPGTSFPSSICSQIRDKAQEDFYAWAQTWLSVLGSVAIVAVFIMSLCNGLVVRIVTPKAILNKLQHIINTFLLMPITFCALIGVYIQIHHTALRVNDWWLGAVFVSVAFVVLIFAIVGAFGGRKKDRRLLAVHMIGTGGCVLGLAACGLVSFVNLTTIEETYGVEDDEVDDVACIVGRDSCCCCDVDNDAFNNTTYVPDERCKAWERDDIVTLIQFDLKLAALISLLSIVFCIGSIVVSFTLHQQLRNHKAGYV